MKPIKLDTIEFAVPYTVKRIVVDNKQNEEKLSQALAKIMEEDRTVLCENDTENGQRLIKGIGEQQLEIIVARLENQYKIPQVQLTAPKVGYKETICAEATARCRYKKQSGGHGQFAEVQITFSPSGNREKDYVFETAVVGGAVSKNYFPAQDLVDNCKEIAAQTGATITLTEDVMEGTKDADVIYTDVWVSMGEPDEVWEKRIKELSPYKVTKEVMANAKDTAIFLHCLPAFHDLKTKIGAEMGQRFGIEDMEVTDEVFESAQSKVFDEAENRMHTIKAVMVATLGEF